MKMHFFDSTYGVTRKAIYMGLTSVGALLLAAMPLDAQTIPAATITSTQTLVTLSNNGGHVAVNSLGDAFYVDQGTDDLYELTPGSTTPITLLTGLSGGRNVAVDGSNNVYAPDNYSGTIVEIPYANGGYATGTVASSVGACTSATPTTPCAQFGNGGYSTTQSYLQATDLAFDAQGNAYVVAERTGGSLCAQASAAEDCNTILKFTPPITPSSTATVLAGGVGGNLSQQNSAQITVDAEGDVFYADTTNLYEVPVTATPGPNAAVIIGSGLSTPGGVGIDSFGNLYVSDTGNNRIVVMPALNGVPQPSQQYTLSYTYTANGVGVDPSGRLFYTGYSNATNISVLTPWSANLGSSALGKANAAVTLSVLFESATTPATVGITSTSGSAFALSSTGSTPCSVGTAYTGDESCTLTVAYTPTAVGVQSGAVTISTAAGTNVATAYLSGTGLGAAQTVDPGTTTTLGSGYSTPQGAAIDSAGNLYVSDAGNNAVYEFAVGSTTATTVGTGLSGPTGIAVDGAGNLFIGDSGNSRVVEVPLQNGVLNSAAQTVVYTGNKSSTGLAVDGTGSLYIADSGNSKVLRITNTDGTPNTGYTATVGTGFVAPIAVAVDPSSDVFVADATANSVTEIVAGTKSQVAISSSLSRPSGLAVDASGSLYIADTGNLRLIKVPLQSGNFDSNNQYQVGQGIVAPYGVAIDAFGNLLVTDSANAAAYRVVRTQGTLNLGNANLNTPTSQLTAEIANSGNQTLTFGAPQYAQSGTTAPFTITSPSTGGCVASGTLATGIDCTLAVSFDPTTKGTVTDTLAFSDNALNTSTPELILTGAGENLALSTTVLSYSPASPVLGQAVTITATVTSATDSGTPTGTVQFTLNGQNTGSPVTVAASSTPNTATATITLTTLSGGPQTIGATYSGDINYSSSAATSVQVTVAQASSTTALTVSAPYSNPTSGPTTGPFTFTAVVVGSGSAAATGTVTFYNGTTVLGTAAVGAQSNPTTKQSFVGAVFAPATLPVGTYSVTAVYSGDVNYAGSSASTPVSLIVAVPTFELSPATSSLTLPAAGSASINLTATSVAGYGSGGSTYIGITCSGLPANTGCSFSPTTFPINPSSSQTITLTISSGLTPALPPPPVGSASIRGANTVAFALLLLAPFGLFGRRALRRRTRMGASLFLWLAITGGIGLALTGCSSSSFTGVTPAGTTTVTITAYGAVYNSTGAAPTTTASTVQQSAQLSLTVQ